MAIEKVLTQKRFVDFLKTLPWWKGGTKYRSELPYNCLYHATNDILWADCNNLVKATIWGKATIPEKGKNWYKPGLYGLNDLNCAQLIDICDRESTDFKEIIPGEILYISDPNPNWGHIGVYVGDFSFTFNGKLWWVNVIEATPSFENGILATYVDSQGNRTNGKGGSSGGRWEKHGLLPWIEYPEQDKPLKYTVKQNGNQTIIDIVEGKGTITVTTNVK